MTVVEYIWLGGNIEFRSKTRVLDVNIAINIDDIPIEGEEEVVEGQEEEKIIVDKLKPKIKAYHDAKGIN